MENNIFDKVYDNGESGFSELGYSLKRGWNIVENPFTGSKTNFRIHNGRDVVLATDFSSGQTYNWFSLAKELKGTDYAWAIAKSAYGIERKKDKNDNYTHPPLPKPVVRKVSKPIETYEQKIIDIQFREWSQNDLAYWKNKIQYKGNDLITFFDSEKMKPLKKVTYQKNDGKIVSVGGDLWFAIEIQKDVCYRLLNCNPNSAVKSFTAPGYEPMRKENANWIYSLGIDTLKNKDVILCAGEKDYFALKVRGYNACTYGNETHKLYHEFSQKVQVLYDTDHAGRKAATRLKKDYKNIEILELPKLEKQKYKIAKINGKSKTYPNGKVLAFDKFGKKVMVKPSKCQNPTKNDVCDYLQTYGYDYDFIKLLDKTTPFCVFDKHLGDNKELFKATFATKNSIWVVPTGSGKTYSALKLFPKFLKENGFSNPIIYCAPLSAITEQAGYDTEGFTTVCDGHTSAYKANLENNIVTTYQSAKTLLDRVEREQASAPVIIIDEFHQLVKGAGYQGTMELMQLAQRVGAKIIGLTATLEPFSELFKNAEFYTKGKVENFSIFNCKRLDNPKYNITVKQIMHKDISNEIVSFIKQNNKGNLVFHESKKQTTRHNISQMAKTLQYEGINCEVFHGGQNAEQKKANPIFAALVQKGEMICDNLIATSVIEMGVSIKKGVENILFVAKERDINSIKQAIARTRAQDVNVYIFVVMSESELDADTKPKKFIDFEPSNIRKKAEYIDKDCYAFNKITEAQTSALYALQLRGHDIYNAQDAIKDFPKLPKNFEGDVANYVRYNKYTKNYFVDYFRIANNFYKEHIRSISYDTFFEQICNIENANVQLWSSETLDFKVACEVTHQEISQIYKNDLETIKASMIESTDVATAVFQEVETYTDSDSTKQNANELANSETPKKIYLQEPKRETCFKDTILEQLQDVQEKLQSSKSEKRILKYTNTIRMCNNILSALKENEGEDLYDVVKRNIEQLQTIVNRISYLNKITNNYIDRKKSYDIAFGSTYAYGLFIRQFSHISAIELEGYLIFDTHLWVKADPMHELKMQQIKEDKAFISNPEQFKDKFKTAQAYKNKYKTFFNDTDNLITLSELLGSFGAQRLHDLFANADTSAIETIFNAQTQNFA